MILNCDAKSLEVVGAAYLSQDPVMMQELLAGVDMHSRNQGDFGLPSRLIAKILIFRTIYGGNEYSFANDPDFTCVSSSTKYWKKVLDQFFDKYRGLAEWHNNLIREVTSTGKYVNPTSGRMYSYSRTQGGDWPVTQIKNYPVQGLGADIMSIARVSFKRRFDDLKIPGVIVNSIHDSIVVDVPSTEVQHVSELFHAVFRDLPSNFKRIFGVDFNLPLLCEVQYGPNMKELIDV
jgi:DNA polymerase I-like protein with 3'-5' exonuclease and polymerase domains